MAWTTDSSINTLAQRLVEVCNAINEREAALDCTKTEWDFADGSTGADPVLSDFIGAPLRKGTVSVFTTLYNANFRRVRQAVRDAVPLVTNPSLVEGWVSSNSGWKFFYVDGSGDFLSPSGLLSEEDDIFSLAAWDETQAVISSLNKVRVYPRTTPSVATNNRIASPYSVASLYSTEDVYDEARVASAVAGAESWMGIASIAYRFAYRQAEAAAAGYVASDYGAEHALIDEATVTYTPGLSLLGSAAAGGAIHAATIIKAEEAYHLWGSSPMFSDSDGTPQNATNAALNITAAGDSYSFPSGSESLEEVDVDYLPTISGTQVQYTIALSVPVDLPFVAKSPPTALLTYGDRPYSRARARVLLENSLRDPYWIQDISSVLTN